MTVGFPANAPLVNVLADDDPTDDASVGGDGTLRITLPPRGMKVFVPQGQ